MIILKHVDGSIAIMQLSADADKAAAIKQFKAHHEEKYIDHIEGEFEIPTDREFRDAWTLSKSGNIVVDAEKAKAITLDRENEKIKKRDELRAILNG